LYSHLASVINGDYADTALKKLEFQQKELNARSRKIDAETLLETNETEKKTARSSYDLAYGRFREWPMLAYAIINEKLPKPISVAKTDVDGRCTGRVARAGKYALTGQFSRDGGADIECFCWLTWAELQDKKPKKIVLNNDNTFASGSPESVLTECRQPHLPND
jgi:hypothetical protein